MRENARVPGGRRLSQAISEGEGISLLATVRDPSAAAAAEGAGADGLVVPGGGSDALRDASGLPILSRAPDLTADGVVLVVGRYEEDGGELERLHAEAVGHGLEPVVEVTDEDELELALELLDPEIFLLSAGGADEDEEPIDRVLSLLPDVPAGKLAIAELPLAGPDDVLALERAGMDAVLVEADQLVGLASAEHPPV
jgi:hypothetical protein